MTPRTDHLIVVNVDTAVTTFDYITGKVIPQNVPMALRPGDRVAWNVQVYVGNTPHPLAYEVSFFGADHKTPNSTFFGRSTLSVPGGTSPFLPVLSLQEKIKYSVSVPGMGTILDPEMQTGEGPVIVGADARLPKAYTVTWNIDNDTVSCKAGNTSIPFPIDIHFNDTFVFAATSAQTPPLIQAAFVADAANRIWASPFFQNRGTVPATPANPTAAIPVLDNVDSPPPPVPFVFTLQYTAADGTMKRSKQLTLNLNA